MSTFSEEHGGQCIPGRRPRPLPHTNLMNKAQSLKSDKHASIASRKHRSSTLFSDRGIPRDSSSGPGTGPRAGRRCSRLPSPRGRLRRRRPRGSTRADTSSSPAPPPPPPHGRDFIHAEAGEELVTRAPWQQERGGGTRGLRERAEEQVRVEEEQGFRNLKPRQRRRRRGKRDASLLLRVSAESAGSGPPGRNRSARVRRRETF